MPNLWIVLRAELRRHLADQWSYPGDSLSWVLYTCLMFGAVVVILNGITGGAYGAQERTLVLVGWLAWQVAGRVMAHLSDAISEEAQAGALERCA